MTIAYKLLNHDLTTYGGCRWVVGEKKTTTGEGELCGPGWLHGYEHAEIAHFLNPSHSRFESPVLYQVEVGGQYRKDGQLKAGWTEMTLIAPVNAPTPTLEQRVRFAIACALQVYRYHKFAKWAHAWLDGSDRSVMAAAGAWAAAAWSAAAAAAAAAAEAAEAAAAAAEAAVAAEAWACSLLRAAQFAMSERTKP